VRGAKNALYRRSPIARALPQIVKKSPNRLFKSEIFHMAWRVQILLWLRNARRSDCDTGSRTTTTFNVEIER
jgi:hypothetical protein